MKFSAKFFIFEILLDIKNFFRENDFMNEIEFYKKNSCFTELGLYKNFAQALPDDIRELCLLQRHQIIHPVAIMKCGGLGAKSSQPILTFHGDMTQIPCDSLLFENERFPTALSILAELLRRENEYSCERKIQNKMHLTCREQAILLAAILKAKGIPARARSGYAPYISNDGVFHDHWICERFCDKENRWILTDADCCVENLDFDFADIPCDKFLFGAQSYLKIRNKEICDNALEFASVPPTHGMRAALQSLFYDLHSLMNDEIFFWHSPRYIVEKNFNLSQAEFEELDSIANLMLEPSKNFEKICDIWESTPKFRIVSGGFN